MHEFEVCEKRMNTIAWDVLLRNCNLRGLLGLGGVFRFLYKLFHYWLIKYEMIILSHVKLCSHIVTIRTGGRKGKRGFWWEKRKSLRYRIFET